MTFDWRSAILTTAVVLVVIYATEYGIALLTENSFQKPSTVALIAAIVGANVGRLGRDKYQNLKK